ncbi:ribonuclease R [Alkalilimnicola ehrlichii MLHE-1]|uniref:Ribonuclease R n=1 Tax=Alkalilimnicola ehrlichii (strain ATCC BAA-1101 / DSM 17681 / MLHE-1) TaxID=187272 RepID=Q0AB53_ALKEH|nr:ribonuclease R [Alkalilimnicola ehrlichii]ABI55934.1 RNAse R [Alkalilimnicola ehrlichii MLHE-1]
MAKRKRSKLPEQDPYLDRERQKYDRPVPSREYLLEVIGAHGRPFTRQELADLLELNDPEQQEGLRRRLRAMERDGQLVRNRRRGYVIVDNRDLVRGRIQGHQNGSGWLRPDDGSPWVYLPPRQMKALMHGDRAIARVVGLGEDKRPEGELVEVLERANSRLLGRYFEESGIGFVVPENKRMSHDIIVPAHEGADAVSGQMVVVEIRSQPTERRQPIGQVVEVLGEHIDPGMEIKVAAETYGIPVEWPEAVDAETAHLGEEVPEAAKADRVDLRNTPLVTIDGADARDFDDAVYCEPTPSGWKLTVAIADVSHYVRPGAALDDEARNRATSVYFPRNVVPMLPEVLSNGLCSLNPKVDRLCMACEMLIDRNGEIKRSRFLRGVMRSHARFTYEQVWGLLQGDDPEGAAEHAELLPHLHHLYELYGALRQARERRGAIDFESSEADIEFDDQGRIVNIAPTRRNDIHKLIEECMIAANVCAARFLERQRIGGLYRVHDTPPEDRLLSLREFLNGIGLPLGGGDKPRAADYAEVMRKVQDRPDRHLIETVMLRSMQAADYRPDNSGHFGLSLDAYAHFTSPIRRYPDLMVHRAIGHILDGGKGSDYPVRHDELVALGEHCSTCERRADDATRDALLTLKCEYMQQHLGDEFNGVISGVTSFGLFIELEDLFVDGLVHVTQLESDFFHFDPASHRLVGERTGKAYQLTDRVRVKIARVDKDERKIDFAMVAHPLDAQGNPLPGSEQGGRGKQGGRKRRSRRQ